MLVFPIICRFVPLLSVFLTTANIVTGNDWVKSALARWSSPSKVKTFKPFSVEEPIVGIREALACERLSPLLLLSVTWLTDPLEEVIVDASDESIQNLRPVRDDGENPTAEVGPLTATINDVIATTPPTMAESNRRFGMNVEGNRIRESAKNSRECGLLAHAEDPPGINSLRAYQDISECSAYV